MAGKIVCIEQRMIKSKAFLSLNKSAIQMLLIFYTKRQMSKVGRGKRKEWECTNTGEIIFTYDEARDQYGITAPRFVRGLDSLIAYGFIDIVEQGGGVKGYTTKYGISERWRLYGQVHFQTAHRQKRSWGWPGFKKILTNDNVRGSSNEIVRGKGIDRVMTTYITVRGRKVKTVFKFSGNKWIEQKVA